MSCRSHLKFASGQGQHSDNNINAQDTECLNKEIKIIKNYLLFNWILYQIEQLQEITLHFKFKIWTNSSCFYYSFPDIGKGGEGKERKGKEKKGNVKQK